MNLLCRKKTAFINRAPFGLHKHGGNWDFLHCLCTPPRTWSECLLKVFGKEDSRSRRRSSSAVVRRIGGETTAGLVGFHLGSRNASVMPSNLNQLDETSLGMCKVQSRSEECDEGLMEPKPDALLGLPNHQRPCPLRCRM